VDNERETPEQNVKDAQIARGLVRTSREGRCCAYIYSPLGNGHSVSGRCSNKAKHEQNGFLFCGTHHPPMVAERNAKRYAERKRQREIEQARWAARAQAENADRQLKDAAVDALRKIAAGHNDPRGLAREILAEHSSPTPPEN
jgi:hypothetical protein